MANKRFWLGMLVMVLVFGMTVTGSAFGQDASLNGKWRSPRSRYGGFENCKSLTSVTIGNSVTSIGESIFMNCDSLASVTIPKSVTSIGYTAFYGKNLTSVMFEGRIASKEFSDAFNGDLRDKYLAADGGPGTYTRFKDGQSWKKQ